MLMSLENQTIIKKPIEAVFPAASDFTQWKRWSPWFIQEPEATFKVSGQPSHVGHKQEWNGDAIGSGQTTMVQLVGKNELHFDLEFFKPWKSKSKTSIYLEEQGEHTRVRWTMESPMPWFLFWLVPLMQALVKEDYRRGLAMLKELVETGQVASQCNFKGTVQRPGFQYLGFETDCRLDELGDRMKRDMTRLETALEKLPEIKPIDQISIYPKFDFKAGTCRYIVAGRFDKNTSLENVNWSGLKGFVPDHQALLVEHRGRYEHLGNAWATVMGRVRHLKKKSARKIYNYEVYKSHRQAGQPTDLITEVLAPIR